MDLKKKKNVGNVNQTMAHIVVIYSLSNHLLTFSCFFPLSHSIFNLVGCFPVHFSYLLPTKIEPFMVSVHVSISHIVSCICFPCRKQRHKLFSYSVFLYIIVQCFKKSFWDFRWYMKQECEAKVGKSWSINVCLESYYLWFS